MKVTYIDHMGTDLSVVNAARVSFNKESEALDWDTVVDTGEYTCSPIPALMEKDKKLINYLAREEHTSPFNHAFISMHVKAPIFVARQLVKHKFMPWNEVSRRYVDEEPEFYVPKVWRGKSEDKKQGSEGVADWPPEGTGSAYTMEHRMPANAALYHRMIDAGVCPEQARMVLPLNTYTEWHWSGTLGAWADMYNLRAKPDTQLETQEIAKQCGHLIEPLFPVSWKALTK